MNHYRDLLTAPRSPAKLPFTLCCGGIEYSGIREKYGMESRFLPEKDGVVRSVYTGVLENGLSVRFERNEYAAFPVTEYFAVLTNETDADSDIIEGFGVTAEFGVQKPVLVHGNGDTCREDGYSWQTTPLTDAFELSPADGTSCNGAFPYMRLEDEEYFLNIAVGWPTRWKLRFVPEDGRLRLFAGQARCHTVLHPGESLRTPRLTLMVAKPDENESTNLWRRWYLRHILPKPDGKPLGPQCCMHLFQADGWPEFTGATEENQLRAIAAYRAAELKPDIWWVDAGWYPCDHDWTVTGTWKPDAERFPNGLKPIGDVCAENGMRFLLWMEPERVRPGTEFALRHPEWLLRAVKPDGTPEKNMLLDLGNDECRETLTGHVCALIQNSGVRIYRQDFNFDPAPYWEQNEAPDRIGFLENRHAAGYLRYWDALLERNPGLLIDSCASGGRRNDLETMRRAVPLHYTDVGYGNHPVKWKQHLQMFRWIPYFRAHNMNWLEENGTYSHTDHDPDRFAFYAAMAPAITDVTRYDAPDGALALSREMQTVWRRLAQLELSGDFYPLTECDGSGAGFEAVQFHDPRTDSGAVLVLSYARNPGSEFETELRGVQADGMYRVEESEGGEVRVLSGKELADFRAELGPHSGNVYFYERADNE